MTSITPISFRGGGSESAGSIAYRNNSPEAPVNENKVNFRGGGAETAGSIANVPAPKPETDTVQFRGSGAETAGSIANVPVSKPETDTVQFRGGGAETAGSIANKPTECPNCGASINFKGSKKEDNTKAVLGVVGGLVALTAATIIGLGYAHKKGAFKNLSDGWIKKVGEKIEPIAKECHSWCASAKKTGLEWWGKLKGSAPKGD